jgi:hypothetical protein
MEMGLLDVVKGLLGDANQPEPEPAMAQITIISSGGVKPTSGSRSVKAQD